MRTMIMIVFFFATVPATTEEQQTSTVEAPTVLVESATELANAPVPKAVKPVTPLIHKFCDKHAKLQFTAAVGAAAFDAAQTCNVLADCGHEDWLPTQNCAGVVGLWPQGSRCKSSSPGSSTNTVTITSKESSASFPSAVMSGGSRSPKRTRPGNPLQSRVNGGTSPPLNARAGHKSGGKGEHP